MSIDCIFCDKDNLEENTLILENKLFYARWDDFPVSQGHAEIVPKRHVESFFELTKKEISQMYNLLKKTKKIIDEKYSPTAYNIGINDGVDAGRTIHHLHIYLIPRYKDDVKDPRVE